MKTEDAIALFASRADMYRQVAQWFFAPLSEEQIDALASQDLRGLAEEDGSPYADGYNDLYRALRLRHTGTRQALAADFTGVFYGATTEGGQTAQPFESLYRCDGGALMGESRGEVYRTLKKARLKVHEGPICPTTISRSTRPMRRSCAIARRPFSARATGLGRCKCSQSSERSSRSISPPGSTISEIGRRPWSRLASIRGY